MGLRSPGGEEDLPGFTREAPPMRRLRDPPGQEIRAGQHLGHFARVQGERRCGHEAETVDQRDAKLALLEALRRALCGGPEGCRIGAELPLADGRSRPGGRSYARGSAAALRAWERGGFFAPSFDLREAVGGVLESAHAAPGLEDRAAGAVQAFVTRLRKEIFLELVDAWQESSLVVDIVKSWTRRLRETIRGGT